MAKFAVAVIVGSNRRESINRKLALAISKLGDVHFEFCFVQIDDLPIYNQDLEGSRPASVRRFTSQIASAQALLFVTPEHNRSLPTVLKNAIDWGSKPADQNVWKGKPAAITGASPGAIGAALAQVHLRQILGGLGALVMGGEAFISMKPELIDDAARITNESTRKFLQTYIDQFAALVARLVGPG